MVSKLMPPSAAPHLATYKCTATPNGSDAGMIKCESWDPEVAKGVALVWKSQSSR